MRREGAPFRIAFNLPQDDSLTAYNLQNLRGDFHSNPLVYSVLSHPQGSNNVIRKSFTCAWIMWKQCSLDVPHNVLPSECNPNLADKPGLWVIHPIPIWNSLLDSNRTVDVQIRFRSNLPNQ